MEIGSTVFKAIATDPDDPNTDNGKLVFSLLGDGANNGPFKIGKLN